MQGPQPVDLARDALRDLRFSVGNGAELPEGVLRTLERLATSAWDKGKEEAETLQCLKTPSTQTPSSDGHSSSSASSSSSLLFSTREYQPIKLEVDHVLLESAGISTSQIDLRGHTVFLEFGNGSPRSARTGRIPFRVVSSLLGRCSLEEIVPIEEDPCSAR